MFPASLKSPIKKLAIWVSICPNDYGFNEQNPSKWINPLESHSECTSDLHRLDVGRVQAKFVAKFEFMYNSCLRVKVLSSS
jgi:hypothetical protein